MALSPESAGRRDLIREMSQFSHRSHSRASAASSDAGSDAISAKDWGTESQQLPALPAFTPQRYSKPHDAEYQINTSALRRAFPEFSQHGSSDEDSMELGRGLRGGSRDPARMLPSEDPSENISLNFGNGERYTVTGTPPMKSKNTRPPTGSQRSAAKVPPMPRTTSEKENMDPAVKHTSFGSGSSSGRESVHKKQPTVFQSVEEDESLPLPSRPKSHYASAKSTRFSSPATRQPLGETKNTPNRQPSHQVNNGTVDSVQSAVRGTYESFALPDMPNMTELLTGSRRDATPTANKSARSKSRFATPSSLRKLQGNGKSTHNELGDVPVPADAKALYLSLQLLQEKVQNLEKERDKAVEKADGYELELLQLRSRVEEQDNEKIADTERAQFEKSIRVLQKRLKTANTKCSTSDASAEELRRESQAAKSELEVVESQLARVNGQHDRRVQELVSQENELRAKIQRREKAVNEMASMAKELWDIRNAEPRNTSAHTRPAPEQKKVSADDAAARRTSATRRQAQPKSTDVAPAPRQRRSNLDDTATIEATSQRMSSAQTVQRHVVDETQELGPRLQFADKLQHINMDDLERCETYLSFMEGDEVAKLRQVLQEDKARLASSGHEIDDYTALSSAKPATAVPRKSSLKKQVQYEDLSDEICQEITGDITRPVSRASARSIKNQRVRDDDPLSREIAFEPETTQDMTRQSVRSTRSNAPPPKSNVDVGVHDDNMTSAYILPDITMTGAALASTVQQKTDKAAPDAGTKTKGTIPRPIPVSERPVSPTPLNQDPTIRPSREPGVALSLVIHSLEAEIARLREQLGKFEHLYQQTDPSLSKRRRKAVWARIIKIGEAVERRADQVYALYDVLEGLKDSGIDMKEEEFEVTLAELGVDAEHVQRVVSTRSAGQGQGQDNDDDSDDTLPIEVSDGEFSDAEGDVFEGFDTTQTGTGVVRGQ